MGASASLRVRSNLKDAWRHFKTTLVRDSQGVTAIEYALLASLVAVGILLGVILLGGTLRDLFGNVQSHMP